MKQLRKAIPILVLAYFVSGCAIVCQMICGGSEKTKVPVPATFSGQVVSNFGKALEDATVSINNESTRTDQEGAFRLTAGLAERYVITIRKKGYAFLSQVYDRGLEGKKWVLTEATVEVVDPTRPIMVRDVLSASGCLGSRGIRSPWERLAVSGGPTPVPLAEALDAAYNLSGCSPGISVAVPANAVVDANGNRPTGSVEVALATVDVFSPDAMPGDFGVLLQGSGTSDGPGRDRSPQRGFMQTFGAGFVSITANGTDYQLAPGAKATLEIPIDPSMLEQLKWAEQDPKPTIPLLLYDEGLAVWRPEGIATLNSSKNAYEAEISHFSAWNMDVVFTQQSCIQFDSRLINGPYHLRLVMPAIPLSPPTLPPHEFDIPNAMGCPGTTTTDPFECFVHSAWSLPSTTQYAELGTQKAAFIPSKSGSDIGIFEVLFGPAHGPVTLPPIFSPSSHGYSDCTSRVILSDKPTLALSMAPPAQVSLSMAAYWGPNTTLVPVNGSDGFRLERCTVSSSDACEVDSGGWGPFGGVLSGGRSQSPVTFTTGGMAVGTYKFRVRAHIGDSSFGGTGVDTVPSDPLELKVTKLRVVNNITFDIPAGFGGYGKVLRLRTDLKGAVNARGGSAKEHMSPDGCDGSGLTGGLEIPPSGSYDVTYWTLDQATKAWDQSYKLFVGLGVWVWDSSNSPACPGHWGKRHFANKFSDSLPGWRYFELNVTNHLSGTEKTFTITGLGAYDDNAPATPTAFISDGIAPSVNVKQNPNPSGVCPILSPGLCNPIEDPAGG